MSAEWTAQTEEQLQAAQQQKSLEAALASSMAPVYDALGVPEVAGTAASISGSLRAVSGPPPPPAPPPAPAPPTGSGGGDGGGGGGGNDALVIAAVVVGVVALVGVVACAFWRTPAAPAALAPPIPYKILPQQPQCPQQPQQCPQQCPQQPQPPQQCPQPPRKVHIVMSRP